MFDFCDTFTKVTGHKPFPWQRRLYERFLQGRIPAACAIPTGLGKTSVIPIWLMALAREPSRVPRRLVYVVNRRTVVDQATREAEKLRDALEGASCLKEALHELCATKCQTPLAISTLRGEHADNREWLADPSRPAIIIGTVDMIGSRLLFSGYRTGSWQMARHAGLLGQDALIVHDEAHLEPVFQKLIEWAAGHQESDGSPSPVKIMTMSATQRSGKSREEITLQRDDLSHSEVEKRFSNVTKRLYLHSCGAGDGELCRNLVDRAWAFHDKNAGIIIYVRKPANARAVGDELRTRLSKEFGANQGAGRVALLTGTIRSYERERVMREPAVQRLLSGLSADRLAASPTTWLVATSAGEVGADFDADHMVCDLSTMDAMIQRFGRVNRRGGEGREAVIHALLDQPEARRDKQGKERELSRIEQARLVTAGLLERLPALTGGDDCRSASPASLGNLVLDYPAEYAAACSPQPQSVLPHEIVLDAWALTSIQEDWPLAHEVHPYLHGLGDQEPDTYVAWRAELDHLPVDADWEPEAAAETVRTILRDYPLRPLELVREKPSRIAALLLAIRRRNPDTWVVRLRHRSVSAQRACDLSDDEKRLARELNYETVILPCSAGGLDDSGMVSTDVKVVASSRDVADFASAGTQGEHAVDRRRVVLQRNDEGRWLWEMVPGEPDQDETDGEPPTMWQAARKRAEQELSMTCGSRVVLSEEDDGPLRMVLLFRKAEQHVSPGSADRLTIDDHTADVRNAARRMAERLKLDPGIRETLELAAVGHDLGKADARWQAAIHNAGVGCPLAKSFDGQAFNADALRGYRHEFGSLRRLVGQLPQDADEDLVLHLVAAHHGRGRPHFESRAMTDPDGLTDGLPACIEPAEMARRMVRLQRRFGHWGLAWLEAIFMAADAAASAGPDAVSAHGSEEEDNES
ncbi:MAG TPA: type I-U CRISPR-associated helicase/endonuclease Cas3 [Phycisphaerae bacterium]|nr:type I-U CRISPR-associated helicase/endonuclease Cas3 [Phycisphaerae bacterium]